MPSSEILDALEANVAELGTRTVWRSVALRRGQSPEDITSDILMAHTIAAARWNPRDIPAVYTAFQRETAAAEGARLKRDQEENSPPTTLTMTVAPLKVHLENVIDLSEPAKLGEVGIDVESLRTPRNIGALDDLDSVTPAQQIGGSVWYLGFAALLVPSVQRWPEINLVIFPDRLGASDCYAPAEDDES